MAENRDAEALPALENSAGTLFRDLPALAWLADEDDLTVQRYRELIARGATWVAVDAEDRPVAFLSASLEPDALHIWEVSVRRDLQRQGLGHALVATAAHAAQQRGVAAVTLTTFREVPWNAPFYSRLGFEIVPIDALGERLETVLRTEPERGLPLDKRCAMRLRL